MAGGDGHHGLPLCRRAVRLNLPHLYVPPGVREPVNSALRTAAQSVSRMATQAAAAMPSISPPSSASNPPLPVPSDAPRAPPVVATEPPVVLAPPPSPVPLTALPPASAPTARSAGAPLSSASSVASGEASEATETGGECRTGQHRCDGRLLQVCNESRDGWANVTECEPGKICDATGSGGCATLGAETRSEGPSETASAPAL